MYKGRKSIGHIGHGAELRAALEAVLAREPELSMFGLGAWDQRRLSPEERSVILKRQRAELLQSRQVAAAIEWLRRIEPRKTINPKRSSYGLKHIAERDIGYLTNGEFIAAAIIAGFSYKRIGHGPNVAFAMSERSIKAAVALRRMARGGDR